MNRRPILTALVTAVLILLSCTRKEIEFGTIPGNEYTNLVYIDTVGVQLSTVIRDSFATGGATSFLLGRYKDPYLGTVSAKLFTRMTIPVTVPEIPASAVFDSLTLIFRPNDYYYGDTTGAQTITVYELDQTITLGYSDKLYNTSDIPVKHTPLGSRYMRLNPVEFDSVSIRLTGTKGVELFEKLRLSSTDISSETAFQQYFKGISLSIGNDDTTAVYGVSGAAGSLTMRVHYHLTIPYHESNYIDFISQANEYAFYQLIPDRTGTGLIRSGTSGSTEIFPANSFHRSFSQLGTGLNLKMIFPGLRSLLNDKSQVRLLKAELLVRPSYLSFDKKRYPLPAQLTLSITDASNIVGVAVADSTGSNTLYATPVIDELYGENNYYRFNITAYIGSWLLTPGSEDDGFFVLNNNPAGVANVDRLVVNDIAGGDDIAQLLLTVLVINN